MGLISRIGLNQDNQDFVLSNITQLEEETKTCFERMKTLSIYVKDDAITRAKVGKLERNTLNQLLLDLTKNAGTNLTEAFNSLHNAMMVNNRRVFRVYNMWKNFNRESKFKRLSRLTYSRKYMLIVIQELKDVMGAMFTVEDILERIQGTLPVKSKQLDMEIVLANQISEDIAQFLKIATDTAAVMQELEDSAKNEAQVAKARQEMDLAARRKK